jgi:hypothetical protein
MPKINNNSNDSTGNSRTVMAIGGFGNSKMNINDRVAQDYYATEPKALELLLEVEPFCGDVWECACGGGHLSEVLKKYFKVRSSDIVNRGYEDTEIFDFLWMNSETWLGNIITNPPYKFANEFIIKSLDIMYHGFKLALFLPIRFLEGKTRRLIFELTPPKTVWISSSRLRCGRNGDFSDITTNAMSFAWFVWQKGYKGETTLKWFN